MKRRILVQGMSHPLLLIAGCKTSGPLVPLKKLAMLPVGNLDRHYFDIRGIVSRNRPTTSPTEPGTKPSLTVDQQDSTEFELFVCRLDLRIHGTARAAIIERVKAAGAVLDVFFDAQGCRPIVLANALTPEVYAETYIYSASNNGNVGGACYSFGCRRTEARYFIGLIAGLKFEDAPGAGIPGSWMPPTE